MIEGIDSISGQQNLERPVNQVSDNDLLFQSPFHGAAQAVEKSGLLQRAQRATTDADRQKIKSEFLAIFYQEILKDAISPLNFGAAADEKNSPSFGTAFANDLLIKKLALELAKNGAFSADKILAGNNNIDEGDK